jgi:ABC-2 type transport system permease protein
LVHRTQSHSADEFVAVAPGTQLYELGQREPASVLRELIAAGVEPFAFAPHPLTLEELYLRHSARGVEAHAPPSVVGAERSRAAPTQRIAPSMPIARVANYEFRRAWSKGSLAIPFALPAVLAAVDLYRNHARAAEAAAMVQRAELATTTDVTAFQALAQALQAGLPLCAVVVIAIASQSLASEYSHGTLRNLLLRPALRRQVVMGKTLALMVLTLLAYLMLAVVTLGSAWLLFDFSGVTEILPDGQRYQLADAKGLWRDLGQALWAPIAPLMAWTAVGVCASALARSGALALALGLGCFVFTDLARAIARGSSAESWLLSAHLPSPLGDSSFLAYYADISQGISNAQFAHAATQWSAPLAWFLCALVIAMLTLSRKRIP